MNEYEYDQSVRNSNGVKVRMDGKGDSWACAHRDGLGKSYYMQDIDCLFGAMAFGHNTGEKLFLEYIPDNYQNREKVIRQFGIVSIFDRKFSEGRAFSNENSVSMALYLHICRVFRDHQSIAPKFFYVIGGQEPPWEMIEIDIETGEKTGQRETIGTQENGNIKIEWRDVWEALGLIKLRNEVAKWVSRQ